MIARSIANISGGCYTLPVALVGAELFLTWCIPMNVTSTGTFGTGGHTGPEQTVWPWLQR